MNWAHIHLMVNHIPVLGTVLLVLLLALGLIRRSPGVIRTALWATVVLAVLTVPVYLTGEPAEEQVEGIIGVEKTTIEEHEEQAKVGLIAVLATGATGRPRIVGREAQAPPHRGSLGIGAPGAHRQLWAVRAYSLDRRADPACRASSWATSGGDPRDGA